MNELVEFFSLSIVWSPFYFVAIVFAFNSWYLTYRRLRDAKKEIKKLNIEKEALYIETFELKLKTNTLILKS